MTHSLVYGFMDFSEGDFFFGRDVQGIALFGLETPKVSWSSCSGVKAQVLAFTNAEARNSFTSIKTWMDQAAMDSRMLAVVRFGFRVDVAPGFDCILPWGPKRPHFPRFFRSSRQSRDSAASQTRSLPGPPKNSVTVSETSIKDPFPPTAGGVHAGVLCFYLLWLYITF